MRKPKNSKVATKILDKEVIVIDTDTDTDEVGDRILALCYEMNNNRASKQIVCADDYDFDLDNDLEYMKYFVRYKENHPFLLENNVRYSSPMRLMFNVDNQVSDRRKSKAVKIEKNRAGRKPKSSLISSISKRLKTENGRSDHKLISVKKEKSKVGKKSKSPSTSNVSKRLKTENGRADHKSTSRTVFGTQQKEGVARQEKKKACKKENKESIARRNEKSQKIFRASNENERTDHNSVSRTIPVVNTKDIQQKKRVALPERKIHVTKNNVESKSTNNRFKPNKKVNEEELSSLDKSYAYYLDYQRNSITIFKPEQQVNPVKDLVCLSDQDIIAVSDHPFSDGGNILFEANKDEKVIDLEDDIEQDMFNSLFSKELMEILRKPYDKKEYLKLYNEVKLKRPLTRCRELRDGREIEYNVADQLALSYLEKYKDFKKKLRRCGKDQNRALNLLRGFFFYLEKIVLEGSFKPWAYEKRLENMCLDCNPMLLSS